MQSSRNDDQSLSQAPLSFNFMHRSCASPGVRWWYREDNVWNEKDHNGNLSVFKDVTRGFHNKSYGSIITKSDGSQVFIPDFSKENFKSLGDYPGSAWCIYYKGPKNDSWVSMGIMENIEQESSISKTAAYRATHPFPVEKEQKNDSSQAPTYFEWIYTGPGEPGLRKWVRIDDIWKEILPSGKEVIYPKAEEYALRKVGALKSGALRGGLITNGVVRIFIPDVNSNNIKILGEEPGWNILLNKNNNKWEEHGRMFHIEPKLASFSEKQPLSSEKVGSHTQVTQALGKTQSSPDNIKKFTDFLGTLDLVKYKTYEEFAKQISEEREYDFSIGLKKNLFDSAKDKQIPQKDLSVDLPKPKLVDNGKSGTEDEAKNIALFSQRLTLLKIDTLEEFNAFKQDDFYIHCGLSEYTKKRLFHVHEENNKKNALLSSLKIEVLPIDDDRNKDDFIPKL